MKTAVLSQQGRLGSPLTAWYHNKNNDEKISDC